MGSVLKRARRATATFQQKSLEQFVRDLRGYLPPAPAASHALECAQAAETIECWRHDASGLWVYASAVTHPDPRDLTKASNEPWLRPWVVHRTLCFVGTVARDIDAYSASYEFGDGLRYARQLRGHSRTLPPAVMFTWHEDKSRLDAHVERHIERTIRARIELDWRTCPA